MCVALLSASVLAQGSIPSDNNSLSGDHLRVQTHAFNFIESSNRTNPPPKCAPAHSGFSIRSATATTYTVRFYNVAEVEKDEKKQSELDKACLSAGLVSKDTSYTIAKEELNKYDFKRSGVTFGGLVVPFKFRLGGDQAVTSSSTVAPYLGFTSRYLQFFGLSLDPVITAGLAFVPVTNPATGTSESKSAFSYGAGFVLTSSKNEQFHAGLIIGKDVLSSSDRAKDPNVDKAWISFYVGAAM
jgi:hypothetical protein